MSRFGLFNKTQETGGIVHCDISQYFAVQIDSGPFQPANEFAVGNSGGAASGVDADDPK
jgi:hypothetical protein